MVAGVVLTGGTSRRLGVDKATVVLTSGETVAERAYRALSAVCDVVVEVGDGVSGALRVAREDPPGAGPLAALLAGVDALAADTVVVLACDLVAVDAALLRSVATAAPDAPGVVSCAGPGGRLQYLCARYGPAMLADARARYAAGERSMRWVVEHPIHVLDVDAALLVDLDTPADAAALGITVAGPGAAGDS